MENLSTHIKDLVDARVQIFKYDIKTELSKSLSKVLNALIIFLLILAAVLFLSIALSIYIGMKLNSYYLGFLIVAGIYLLLSLILIIFKKQIGIEKSIEANLNAVFGIETKEKM